MGGLTLVCRKCGNNAESSSYKSSSVIDQLSNLFQVSIGDCFILIQDDCDLTSAADSDEGRKIVLIQIDDVPTSAPSEDDTVPDTPTLISLTEAMATSSNLTLLPLQNKMSMPLLSPDSDSSSSGNTVIK